MHKFIPRLLIYSLLLSLWAKTLSAQSVPSTADFIEITTENDFYYLRLPSDRYYTSGKKLSLQAEIFETGRLAFGKLFPLRFSKLNAINTSQVEITHNMYSPFSIRWDQPQQLDRPYAATLDLNLVNTSYLPNQQIILKKALQLGWLGPSAKGAEIQRWFHRLKGRPLPKAWTYQLADRPFWAIQMQLEKTVVSRSYHLLLLVPQVQLGNIQQNLTVGLHYKVGDIDRYFRPHSWSQQKLHWYAYFHLNGQYVHKNDLINGPMRPSEFVKLFQSPQVENQLWLASYGIILERKGWELHLSQHAMSPEFTGGSSHYWGGMALKKYL